MIHIITFQPTVLRLAPAYSIHPPLCPSSIRDLFMHVPHLSAQLAIRTWHLVGWWLGAVCFAWLCCDSLSQEVNLSSLHASLPTHLVDMVRARIVKELQEVFAHK